MIILGIGGLLNDAACAVLKDGELVAAVEQKKVARRFQPGELPAGRHRRLPAHGRRRGRTTWTAWPWCGPSPAARRRPCTWSSATRSPAAEVVLVEHHVAHAASAYYASPFERGHRADARPRRRFPLRRALAAPAAAELTLEKELYYPDSLGDLYGRVTELLGFEPNADEHKVQWLSASGDDRFHDAVPRDPLAARRRLAAHRPLLLPRRARGAAAASARSSTSAWASRTAPQVPEALQAVGGGGPAAGRRADGRRDGRRAARTCAWPAGWR